MDDLLTGRIEALKLLKASEMLKTAAHPQRLAILDLLSRGEKLNNTELQEKLHIEQAILSQHLTLMREKGLLDCKRVGRHSYYYLKHQNLSKIIDCLEYCSTLA